MASTTAATTTTSLKTSNAEDGADAEATTASAFTPEQLQQLLIQLLPYNQMQAEEKDQQQEESDEVGGRLIIADDDDDEEEGETARAEKTTDSQMERESSLMDAHLHKVDQTNGQTKQSAAQSPVGQRHLAMDEQPAGPSTIGGDNDDEDAINNDGDGVAESLSAPSDLPNATDVPRQNGQNFVAQFLTKPAKRKLNQPSPRKRPDKGGGGNNSNSIGANQNWSNNQTIEQQSNQKAFQKKKKKSPTTIQKGQQIQQSSNESASSPATVSSSSLPFPPNFGQQLADLFSIGLQQLLTLGGGQQQSAIVDDTSNPSSTIPNPLANISVEELGRMVMEQMCKEIGDQAQQILTQLAEIAPDASQEELMSAVALTMSGQFGLIPDPNHQNGQSQMLAQMDLCNQQQQQQQQFWQAIQLGLAQAMATTASMAGAAAEDGEEGEKDDSGIVADDDADNDDQRQIEDLIQQEEAFGQQQLQALAECFSMAMVNGNLNGIDQEELFAAMLQQQVNGQQQNGGNTLKKSGQKTMPGQPNCSTTRQKQQKGLVGKSRKLTPPSSSANAHHHHHPHRPSNSHRNVSLTSNASFPQTSATTITAPFNSPTTTITTTNGGQQQQQKRDHQNVGGSTSSINAAQLPPESTALFSNQFVGQNDPYQLHQICRPGSAQSSSTTISSSAASSAFSPSLLCANTADHQSSQQQQWDHPALGAAAMAAMCQQFVQIHQQSTTTNGDGEYAVEMDQNQQQQQMLAIQMLSQMLISSQQQSNCGGSGQPSTNESAAFAAILLNGAQQQQQGTIGVDPATALLLQQQPFNVPTTLSIPTSILAAMVDQSQQQQMTTTTTTTTTHQPAIVPNPLFAQQNQHLTMKTEPTDETEKELHFHPNLLPLIPNENSSNDIGGHFGMEMKGSIPANAMMFFKREATDSTADDHNQLGGLNGNNRRKKPREGRARIGSQGAATLSSASTNALATSTLVPGIAGTLTAKNEKSLGALLLQNPEGAERVEELKELEDFANSFKKQRIKHGFTQGDVGVALGKRYGTDFSQTTISRFEALNLSFKNMCKLRPLLEDWLTETERLLGAGATVQDVMEGIALQRVAALEIQQAKQQQQVAISQQPMPASTNVQQQQQSSPELMAAAQLLDQQQIFNGIMAAALGGGGSVDQHCKGAMGTAGSGSMIPPFKKRRKRTNLDSAQKASLDAYFRTDPRPDNGRMNDIARILDLDQDVVRVWFCNRRQKLRKV